MKREKGKTLLGVIALAAAVFAVAPSVRAQGLPIGFPLDGLLWNTAGDCTITGTFGTAICGQFVCLGPEEAGDVGSVTTAVPLPIFPGTTISYDYTIVTSDTLPYDNERVQLVDLNGGVTLIDMFNPNPDLHICAVESGTRTFIVPPVTQGLYLIRLTTHEDGHGDLFGAVISAVRYRP